MKVKLLGLCAVLALSLQSVTVGAETAAQGGELYKKNCQVCHGSKGHGDGPAGIAMKAENIIEELAEHAGDEAHLVEEVMEGDGAMPAWKGVLTEPQVLAIFEYLKGIQ